MVEETSDTNNINIVNILHLSDLHFNRDTIIRPTPIAQQMNALNQLIDELKTIESDWKPDIVVISGDIGWSGKVSDYEQAKEWIRKLLQAVELSPERLVICPGNHDIDLSATTGLEPPSSNEQADEWLKIENWNNHYRPFSDFKTFLENVGVRGFSIGHLSDALVGQKNIAGLRFIVLNSAWFSRGRGQSEKGSLWIGQPQLDVMSSSNQLIHPREYNSSDITIAVIHHPIDWFHDRELEQYGGRTGAYNFLARRCHLILSGHIHAEKVSEPHRIRSKAHLCIGGTSYGGNNYQNNFSILKVDKDSRKFTRRIFYSNLADSRWVELDEDIITLPLNSPDPANERSAIAVSPTTPATTSTFSGEEIKGIHLFLDELNDSVKQDFPTVAETYFPDTWKVGFISQQSQLDYITYSLNPIKWESNEQLIVELTPEEWRESIKNGIISTDYTRNKSDFIFDPKKIAYNLVLERLREIFDRKALDHKGIEFLAMEYIFFAIDRLSDQIGLEINSSYSLDEVKIAFDRIARGRSTSILFLRKVRTERVSLDLIDSFLSDLEEQGITSITRIYRPPDYRRPGQQGLIYNEYTPEDLESNIRLFYDNLLAVYGAVVKNNFPRIVEKLALFDGATKVLVELDLKDWYTSISDSPRATTLCLRNREDRDLSIQVFREEEGLMPEISNNLWSEGINLDGKDYELVSLGGGVIDYIFNNLPMLNYIYSTLWRKLSED
ncbi:MAG: metallophosphoesterase family protein [Candidatus Odinarchaeota archaeon]